MSTAHYEPRDLPADGIAKTLIGLLAGLLISIGLIVGLLMLFSRGHPAAPAPRQEPPAPRLEPDPQADRARLEGPAQEALTHYGWSNRSAGLAHIPIDRAMQIVAARGWGEDAPAPSADETARAHREAGQ